MKSQKITKDIHDALLSLIKESGKNQEDLCKEIGVCRATWCAWVNQNNNNNYTFSSIKPKNWTKLYPYIKKYLPASFSSEYYALGSSQNAISRNEIKDEETDMLLKKWRDIDVKNRLRTLDLLTQWIDLDSMEQLKTLNFIAQLHEEKNKSVSSRLA